MSDEIKVTEEKECKCFCKSEGFKKFIIVSTGSFVGVYCALSLFTALHRPPMVRPHGFRNCPAQQQVIMHHKFDRRGDVGQRHDFQGKYKKDFEPNAPKPEK